MTAANRGLQCIPDVHPSLLSQEQFSDLVQQPALLHASGLVYSLSIVRPKISWQSSRSGSGPVGLGLNKIFFSGGCNLVPALDHAGLV